MISLIMLSEISFFEGRDEGATMYVHCTKREGVKLNQMFMDGKKGWG